jgi:PilZ domain
MQEASVRQEREERAVAKAAPAEARSSERHGIRKHAILHCHDRVQTVLLRDISSGGVKIQNAFGLVAGDTVRLELLTRRTFEGTVAWSVPPYCGIRFTTPLAEDDPLLLANAPRAAHS